MQSGEICEQVKQTVSKGMETSCAWLNRLAIAAILYGLAGVTIKLTGAKTVSLFGLSFPSEYLFFGYFVLTMIHAFVMVHIIQSSADAWQNLTVAQRQGLYQSLVKAGGILTKGAVQYKDSIRKSEKRLVLDTQMSQPTVWVNILVFVLAFLSIVQFSFEWQSIGYLWASLLILLVNWQLGANWMLALADLGRDSEQSLYFENGYGPRGLDTVGSSVCLGENTTSRKYIKEIMFTLAVAFFLFVAFWKFQSIKYFLFAIFD